MDPPSTSESASLKPSHAKCDIESLADNMQVLSLGSSILTTNSFFNTAETAKKKPIIPSGHTKMMAARFDSLSTNTDNSSNNTPHEKSKSATSGTLNSPKLIAGKGEPVNDYAETAKQTLVSSQIPLPKEKIKPQRENEEGNCGNQPYVRSREALDDEITNNHAEESTVNGPSVKKTWASVVKAKTQTNVSARTPNTDETKFCEMSETVKGIRTPDTIHDSSYIRVDENNDVKKLSKHQNSSTLGNILPHGKEDQEIKQLKNDLEKMHQRNSDYTEKGHENRETGEDQIQPNDCWVNSRNAEAQENYYEVNLSTEARSLPAESSGVKIENGCMISMDMSTSNAPNTHETLITQNTHQLTTEEKQVKAALTVPEVENTCASVKNTSEKQLEEQECERGTHLLHAGAKNGANSTNDSNRQTSQNISASCEKEERSIHHANGVYQNVQSDGSAEAKEDFDGCMEDQGLCKLNNNDLCNSESLNNENNDIGKLKPDLVEGGANTLSQNLPSANVDFKPTNSELRLLLERVQTLQSSLVNPQNDYDRFLYQAIKGLCDSVLLDQDVIGIVSYGTENDVLLKKMGICIDTFQNIVSYITQMSQMPVANDNECKIHNNVSRGSFVADDTAVQLTERKNMVPIQHGVGDSSTCEVDYNTNTNVENLLNNSNQGQEVTAVGNSGCLSDGSPQPNKETKSSGSDEESKLKSRKGHVSAAVSEKLEIRRICISPKKNKYKEEKVILLLGASGSGKTTLVKMIANLNFGFATPEECLSPENKKRIEKLVDNVGITAYVSHPIKTNGPAFTVIDTPGFSDLSGEEIRKHTETLENFLTKVIPHSFNIHAVGFVIQAHIARLTPSEELVMEYVTKHFEQGSAQIIPFITFADNEKKPPAIRAIREHKMSVAKYFLFNNSVLFHEKAEEVGEIERQHWRRGSRNWEKICQHMLQASALPIKQPKSRTQSEETRDNATSDVPGIKQVGREPPFHKLHSTSSLNAQAETLPSFALARDKIAEAETEKAKLTKKLHDSIVRFAEALDHGHESFYNLREVVWDIAEQVHSLQGVQEPVEPWLYRLTFDICCQCKLSSKQKYSYPSVLSLSKRKPIVHIGCAIVNYTATMLQPLAYQHKLPWPWSNKQVDIQKLVLYNAKIIIQNILAEYNVHWLMTAAEFVNYLKYEVPYELAVFINENVLGRL